MRRNAPFIHTTSAIVGFFGIAEPLQFAEQQAEWIKAWEIKNHCQIKTTTGGGVDLLAPEGSSAYEFRLLPGKKYIDTETFFDLAAYLHEHDCKNQGKR